MCVLHGAGIRHHPLLGHECRERHSNISHCRPGSTLFVSYKTNQQLIQVEIIHDCFEY